MLDLACDHRRLAGDPVLYRQRAIAVGVLCTEARLVSRGISGVHSCETTSRQASNETVDSVENVPSTEHLQETNKMTYFTSTVIGAI